ncbi:MAG: HlyD family efflux transporter periplasmic adaptor subunit [Burkholderiales bacterium]|nr:HlyD family efflux transporter periplasmic adaptor subunit [Burkholderiales bacterium]MDR4516978.1 HlyD family secretion protein [Nitrosomonas sp.]
MNKKLFRSEALTHREECLYGEVLIARSLTIRFLVWISVLFAVAVACFIFWGQHTRKEHVLGYLIPTQGMIRLFTPQTGIVLEKFVTEGQIVKKGERLLVISSERATEITGEAHATMLSEIRQRRDSHIRELSKQQEIDIFTADSIAGRIRGLETEIRQAEAQLTLLSKRVVSAERNVGRHEKLLKQGFISEAAVQQKEEELIDQQNLLIQVQQNITSLTRELDTAHMELSSSRLRGANNSAAIERQISELEQQLTEADTRRSIVLTAPADGTVTTILTETGQTVNPEQLLLSILPVGAQLQAQLLVPTRAVGFIKPTQQVSLRYQAFPYQRFGHHLGEIVEVGRTAIQPNESSLPVNIQEPVYRVTVRLPQQQIQAYGQAMQLQAGMLLDADIHIDRRRLIEWIFDPLLSISGRL